jgi:hypothetical protein
MRLALILTFLMTLMSFKEPTPDKNGLVYYIVEKQPDGSRTYVFISAFNVKNGLEYEIADEIVVRYFSDSLPKNDTLSVKTSLGVVTGLIDNRMSSKSRLIDFNAIKYVWNNGEILYIEDRKKF